MPLCLAVVLAATHLVNAHLIAAPMGDDAGGHGRSTDKRRAQRDIIAASDEEHLVEYDLRADVRRYLLYFQLLPGADAVLLAAGFYDRIHGEPLLDWVLEKTAHSTKTEGASQSIIAACQAA